ncbi:MAG: DUF4298 domain-containing protein [Clostridia bacterium]|nr:DUF4298 domain-containing protein [Clostridia bacterium]
MKNDSIKRIEYYEPILSESEKAVKSFEKELKKFRKQCRKISELSAYYGGDEWFSDFESYEKGEIGKNVKCGVLSEDEIFDVIEKCRETAVEMLDISSYILKNI